jgi:hypothetical protein
VTFCARFEGHVGFGGYDGDDFAAPAELLLLSKTLRRRNGRGRTPTTPQVLIDEYLASISFTVAGTFAAVLGGAPVVLKKLPRAFLFSSLSGGYLYLLLALFIPCYVSKIMGENVPGDISRVPFEPIRHEDLVLVVLVRGREDISPLEGLREVAKDIVDVKNGLRSVYWAGDVCLFYPH